MDLALVVLAGCNSWFGNDPVVRIDAQKFDAPIDAPSQCPPIGQTPQFTTVLHQDVLQLCFEYRINGGRAVGVCPLPTRYGVFEGLIDQQMQEIPELIPMNTSSIFDEAELSSDAQTLFLREVDFDTGTFARAARRQPDGTWTFEAPPEFGQNPNDLLAGVASGPTGDHAFVRANDNTVHEWIDDNGTWRETLIHPFGSNIQDAQITPDGLRITLFTSNQETLFSDRPDEGSSFRDPETLVGAPPAAQAPTLTEDCGRLYMTGLSSVFYVQQ